MSSVETEQLSSNLLSNLTNAYQLIQKMHMSEYWQGELKLLALIASDEHNSMTPSQLRSHLSLSGTRITAALNSLEKKELIHRELSHVDRRNIQVSVTEKGAALVKEKSSLMQCHIHSLIEKLGEKDAAEFNRILSRILTLDLEIEEP